MNHYNPQTDRFAIAPQLSLQPFNQNGGHWQLSTEMVDLTDGGGTMYCLRVRRYWDGEQWDHFKFFRCNYDIGDPVELFTREEWEDHEESALANGGIEASNEWSNLHPMSTSVVCGFESKLKAALIRRWQAIAELVTPHNT